MIIRAGFFLIMTTLAVPALAGSAVPKGSVAKVSVPKASVPKGFVYLRDVDPTIVQDIRYAGSNNFVGRPIKGYRAAECILSDRAASALKTVQGMLAEKKLSLIVWDCYRPKRAVDDFLQWSKDPAHAEMKAEFYPRTDKQKLFALGYLATRSAHSRGSTVDLGLVPSSFSLSPPPVASPALKPLTLKSCTLPKGERFEDGTIDLGTGYDCLDVMGATSNTSVGEVARRNRQILKSTMARAGFRPYAREWWHFELIDQPFHRQGFDFEISESR